MDHVCSANVDSVALTPVQDFEGITILEGDPKLSAHLLVGHYSGALELQQDGSPVMVGVFACGPAKTSYMLQTNETIHVLEGEVRVELDNGDVVELGPGDIAFFPKGHLSTWTIKTSFKEFFVLHN